MSFVVAGRLARDVRIYGMRRAASRTLMGEQLDTSRNGVYVPAKERSAVKE